VADNISRPEQQFHPSTKGGGGVNLKGANMNHCKMFWNKDEEKLEAEINHFLDSNPHIRILNTNATQVPLPALDNTWHTVYIFYESQV
jgi:hypothetical protein